MFKTWPMLYKVTSTGKVQFWEIRVEDANIITCFGQEDGKVQETAPTLCIGMNVGRSNETFPEQQAVLEAEAQWTKKLKKDYVKTKEEALAGESSDLIEGGILPMLAHKFSEQGHKIKYPAYVQPKLDGARCIAVLDEHGKCTLWSRTRKQIFSMPHIVKQLEDLRVNNCIFDGEGYSHKYKDHFEDLMSLIRQEVPADNCTEIEYHIYDFPSYNTTFEYRLAYMREALRSAKESGQLRCVETLEVANEDELMLAFEKFLAQGYEGAIVRNADGPYVNKRSYDLQKIKEFDDAEFKITGVKEGHGKLAGHGIFKCVTDEGNEFEVKMTGDIKNLRDYFEHPEKYIGKLLTVKYQGLTKKNCVPRFGVGLRLREDI